MKIVIKNDYLQLPTQKSVEKLSKQYTKNPRLMFNKELVNLETGLTDYSVASLCSSILENISNGNNRVCFIHYTCHNLIFTDSSSEMIGFDYLNKTLDYLKILGYKNITYTSNHGQVQICFDLN